MGNSACSLNGNRTTKVNLSGKKKKWSDSRKNQKQLHSSCAVSENTAGASSNDGSNEVVPQDNVAPIAPVVAGGAAGCEEDASTVALSASQGTSTRSSNISFISNANTIDLTCFDDIIIDHTSSVIEETDVLDDYKQSLGPLRLSYEAEGFRGHFALPSAQTTKKSKTATRTSDDDDDGDVLAEESNVFIQQHIIELIDGLPCDKEKGSIFVRVLDQNPQILRALFTGPEGTPYSNGCFFFDLYLKDYPHKAPQVRFCIPAAPYPNAVEKYTINHMINKRTGTLTLAGWDPTKSTLRLLLNGMQRSIFHVALQTKHKRKNAPNIQYNKSKRNTLMYGINVFLESLMSTYSQSNEPAPSSARATATTKVFAFPEFEDVVMKHFVEKLDRIQKQCEDLVKLDNHSAVTKVMVQKVKSKLLYLDEIDRIQRACAISKQEYHASTMSEAREQRRQNWNDISNDEEEGWMIDEDEQWVPPGGYDEDKDYGDDVPRTLTLVVSEDEEGVEQQMDSEDYAGLPPTLVAHIEGLVSPS